MKVKLFYSKTVEVKDGDVLTAYCDNHPGVDYDCEPELTKEILKSNKHGKA